ESLSQYQRLTVSTRAASFHYKGQSPDPRRVARELNVRTVLLGSLAGTNDGLSVTLELVDGGDGHRLWQEKFSGRLSALVDLRQEIVDSVSRRLGLQSGDRARQRAHTNDSEAYALYLKGRYVWNKRTEDGF